MFKALRPFVFSDGQEEDLELARWAWDSHYWIEKMPGYYECKYCKETGTSTMGIGKDYPLCKENPILKGKI